MASVRWLKSYLSIMANILSGEGRPRGDVGDEATLSLSPMSSYFNLQVFSPYFLMTFRKVVRSTASPLL